MPGKRTSKEGASSCEFSFSRYVSNNTSLMLLLLLITEFLFFSWNSMWMRRNCCNQEIICRRLGTYLCNERILSFAHFFSHEREESCIPTLPKANRNPFHPGKSILYFFARKMCLTKQWTNRLHGKSEQFSYLLKNLLIATTGIFLVSWFKNFIWFETEKTDYWYHSHLLIMEPQAING